MGVCDKRGVIPVTRRSTAGGVGALSLILAVSTVGCAARVESLCDVPASVAGYVTGFDQDLGNLEADQFLGLRVETVAARATLRLVAADESADPEIRSAAEGLESLVGSFESRLDEANWDISVGLEDSATREIVDQIGSPETLKMANLVESLVIERCGLPPIVPNDPDTADSLPGPSIPPPTATDPPTDTIDERSEARSLGTTIGETFGLTLDDTQVVCLGLALEGVYDASGSATGPEKYQSQFQAAFDRCEIDFTVPG